MTATTSSTSPRRSFTLVELLVAMALVVFIMVILTEAFTAGIATFRTLKAQGDMQEKLRAASSLLRDDLLQAHFDSAQKLSTISSTGVGRPQGGYFYIRHWASALEGNDGLNIPSYRMNAAQTPVLCFTVRRQGTLPEDYFVARIPITGPEPSATERLLFGQGPADYRPGDGFLISREAEVGYFLVPTGDTAAGTTPLYSLRRRVRVIVPDNPTITNSLNVGAARVPVTSGGTNLWAARYAEVSCLPDLRGGQPNFLHFNRFSDLTNPDRQVMPQPLPRSLTAGTGQPPSLVQLGLQNQSDPTQNQGDPSWFGDDLVLTDVVSFNVRRRASGTTVADFTDLNGVYNTGVSQTRISALEITIRVWDVKTQLTRQMTIIQDM